MTVGQELGHQIQREIMATDDDQRAFDLVRLTIEVDRDRLSGFGPLTEARNPYDAVGSNQRGDNTRAATDRCHRVVPADFAHGDPHKIVITRGRNHLAG